MHPGTVHEKKKEVEVNGGRILVTITEKEVQEQAVKAEAVQLCRYMSAF